MILPSSPRTTASAVAVAVVMAGALAAPASAAAGDFAPFAGTWTSQDGTVTIGAGGSGSEVLADRTHVAFQLRSVGDSVGAGSVTRSSGSGDVAVGVPVTVWTTALGDGPLLTIETGGVDTHFCSAAVVSGGECMP